MFLLLIAMILGCGAVTLMTAFQVAMAGDIVAAGFLLLMAAGVFVVAVASLLDEDVRRPIEFGSRFARTSNPPQAARPNHASQHAAASQRENDMPTRPRRQRKAGRTPSRS